MEFIIRIRLDLVKHLIIKISERSFTHRYSAIGKLSKNDHGVETIGDLTNNFSVLKRCNGKLECLIYEMLFIKKKRPCLNTHNQTPYVQNYYLNLSLVTCIFYVLSPCTVYIKLSILFSFHLKMMTWSHRNVV